MAITLTVRDGLDIGDWSISGSDVTSSSVAIGTASSDRIVVLAFGIERGQPIDDVLIDGVSVGSQIIKSDGFGAVTSSCVAWRVVSSGTTCDVEVQMSASGLVAPRGQIYTITGAEETAYDTDSDAKNGADASCSLDIPANGCAIAALFDRTGSNKTWTGLTEDYDDSTNRSMSAASDSGMSSETGRTITATPSNNNGVLTCVSFEEAAGGSDLDVSVTTPTMTLTPQSVTVTKDLGVDVDTAALTVTPQSVAVTKSRNVAVSTPTLTLTPNTVDVSLARDVPVAAGSLTLTPHPVTVSKSRDVQASTPSLTVTPNAVSVGKGTDIPVDLAALTLTPHAVTVAKSLNVPVTTPGLTVTPHAVTISAGSAVNVSLAELTLTPHAVTVTKSRNVSVSTSALTLTPQAVTVTTGTEIPVTSVDLTLTPQPVTVTKKSAMFRSQPSLR